MADEQDMGVPSGTGSRASHEAASASSPEASIPNADADPIVGHKTFYNDERGHWHEPLRKSEAEAIWAEAEAEREKRHRDMPDEQAAIRQLWDAQERLKELGWKDPVYAPKDGSPLDVIELGSTGIHRAYYEGEWPNGVWWLHDGDVWPCRPALARAAIATEARRAETTEIGSVHEGADPEGIAHD
jgi:hypothetical protein